MTTPSTTEAPASFACTRAPRARSGAVCAQSSSSPTRWPTAYFVNRTEEYVGGFSRRGGAACTVNQNAVPVDQGARNPERAARPFPRAVRRPPAMTIVNRLPAGEAARQVPPGSRRSPASAPSTTPEGSSSAGSAPASSCGSPGRFPTPCSRRTQRGRCSTELRTGYKVRSWGYDTE